MSEQAPNEVVPSENSESPKNMIEDLGLISGAGLEQWEPKIKEKLGLSIADMQTPISEWTINHAEELVQQFANIAPQGDYDKLIEDGDEMISFLKTEAAKPGHWKLVEAKWTNNMYQFIFDCQVVDEGNTFKGLVFVSKSGKIRHAFTQNDA